MFLVSKEDNELYDIATTLLKTGHYIGVWSEYNIDIVHNNGDIKYYLVDYDTAIKYIDDFKDVNFKNKEK